MKFKAILLSFVLLAMSAGVLARGESRTTKPRVNTSPDSVTVDDDGEKVERSVSADSAVTVSICVMAGNITVRGWDEKEVRVQSSEASQIEFRRKDGSAASTPAKKLEVVVVDKSNARKGYRECPTIADVELDLPRGATVHVQTRDGDISISEIGFAYAWTQNGDIRIDGVTRAVEVGTIGGGIEIRDSSGRINVSSVSGNVEASNLKPVDASDAFEVVSVSGDITLDQVTHTQLNAKTVNGNVNLNGPLATGGRYGFNTFSGDVTLKLPVESSFRLTAKVSQGGEVITDFPLTLVSEPSAVSVVAPVAAVATVAPVASVAPVATVAGTATVATVAPVANVAPVATVAPESSDAPPSQPKAPAQPEPAADPAPAPEPPSTPVIKVTPRVHTIVKVDPVIVQAPFVSRRISAVYGKGDAAISVASFSGTLHLQKL